MRETNDPIIPASRRSFLRRVAVAGALTLAPALTQSGALHPSQGAAPAQGSPTQRGPIRVGLLLPQSTLYPSLDQSFADGMQLGFGEAQRGSRPVQLLAERYGVSPAAALARARRLLTEGQVDLLTGFVSANAAAALDPLLRERQALMVVSDIGANVVSRKGQRPSIFRSSLGYWQSNLALGAWAGAQLGGRAVMATSFYDSGYDTLFAFRSGFTSAGGTIADTVLSHHPAQPRDMAPALAAIAAQSPDVVYAAYSGHRATDFLRAFAASDMAGRVPLIGPGFLTDERLLPEAGSAALGVRTALAWSPELPLAQRQGFTAAYRAHTGRAADPIAVLGYDTAHLIAAALGSIGGNVSDTAGLRLALSGAAFAGPRGLVAMHPAERETAGPLYLREVRAGRDGLANAVVGALAPIPADDARVERLRADRRSGWLNAYLCV